MIHLIGLPHTPFDLARSWSCAYTTKALNWLKVLAYAAEEATVYWGGDSLRPMPNGLFTYEAVIDSVQQKLDWGEYDPTNQPQVTWGSDEPRWRLYNHNLIKRLQNRVAPGDVLAFWSGEPFRPVMEWAKSQDNLSLIEPAIGYEGIVPEHTSCGFESIAWMHTIYGKRGINDGRWFDRVIHGYADPEQFDVMDKADEPYVLFLGRIIPRKGPHVASQIAERAGIKFVCAGTGATWDPETKLVTGNGVQFKADEFVGAAAPTERARLMARATAVIVPTLYIEPFGTVHVEAQMAGTPSISSPFGVFAETSQLTEGGLLFHNPAEAVELIDVAAGLDPQVVRTTAVQQFSPQAIAHPTSDWLDQVRRLSDGRYWYG